MVGEKRKEDNRECTSRRNDSAKCLRHRLREVEPYGPGTEVFPSLEPARGFCSGPSKRKVTSKEKKPRKSNDQKRGILCNFNHRFVRVETGDLAEGVIGVVGAMGAPGTHAQHSRQLGRSP